MGTYYTKESTRPVDSVHRICIVGDNDVGKTSFIKRFDNRIDRSSIGVNFAMKIKKNNNDIFKLQLLDIGTGGFCNISRTYYQ